MDKQAGFQNKATLQHFGGKNFVLLYDLIFYSAEFEQTFIAPAGTETDFASIPVWAQSFVHVLGNNIRSSILHDFHSRPEGKKASRVTQKQADALFREGLAVDEVRWSKARVMFMAVSVFQRVKYLFKRGERYG